MLLAALIAIGLSLSSVQAADMTVKMSMTSSMDMSADGDCAGCPDDNPGSKIPCPAVCVAPVLALVPQGPSPAVSVSRLHLEPVPCLSWHGRQTPPDPYPPRSIDMA
ncbi:hypothetical protein RB623_27045 [Mesorhizobium sp. LHD-90]|uniref:hypothetical protein n=1 Tax=Mesorhizobium sp. LHD-90 TaxID=3071414 RepID=UPI0027E1F894|nr:hypothetical protein [Mesorhizobium sp. LHD-90]MDQ6437725.1 hypothetical protein [Mesorhizobium sp. LHD-90]